MNDESRHQQNRRNRNQRHRNRSRDNQGGGSRQRPLLTSAITGAGLCLVALCVAVGNPDELKNARMLLGASVIVFSLSALVSYFAQRMAKIKVVEKISDVFFLTGAVLIIILGLSLGGFVAPLPVIL